MSDFERALPFILKAEGGYVDDPADPGGATNKGITQAVYDAWRHAKGLAPEPVKQITNADVEEIYRVRYWLAGGCEALGWPLSLAHFDACVNMGVGQAGKLLARAGGSFPMLLLERIAFYDRLAISKPKLAKFLRGWTHRVIGLMSA